MGTNVEVSWVDCGAPVGKYEEAIKPNTKVMLVTMPLALLHIIPKLTPGSFASVGLHQFWYLYWYPAVFGGTR